MAAKRRSLGKGLDALLAGSQRSSDAEVTPETTDRVHNENDVLRELPVDLIQRGQYQPRRDFDPEALAELAESIKAQGVMQPIIVRPVAADKFEIIAGERRWRAVQLAGLDRIPALVREVNDDAAVAMALIENIQREDLNPIEEAVALERLQAEFQLTQQQIADAVGKSRSAVANLLRLMTLEPDVRRMLERRELDMGHARCLLSLGPEHQLQAARHVVSRGLSVRQAEALVRKLQAPAKPSSSRALDPDIRRLQDELSQKLGSPVQLQHSSGGKGKVVISYTSLDELDGILALLR
jgi:ParB family chromosome partitioning protein